MSDVVKIRKENKIKYVPAGRLQAFLNQGYDHVDEKGEVIQKATGGSYVPIGAYNKVLEENEKLKSEIEKLKEEKESAKPKKG